jgi:hypothetical protein
MKIIKETLQNKGKWSQKRLMTFSSFFVATIYAFLPLFKENFDVKEFVFIGFLSVGGFSLYRTQKPNENITTDIQE